MYRRMYFSGFTYNFRLLVEWLVSCMSHHRPLRVSLQFQATLQELCTLHSLRLDSTMCVQMDK